MPARPLHQTIRDHIIGHHSHSTDDSTLAETHKLMDATQTTHNHIILNHHVTSNRSRIHNDDPIGQTRIMGDMAAGHQQTIVANECEPAATLGARIDGNMLANGGTLADF